MVRNNDGYRITHSRVKQRRDATESIFLVPEQGRFAACLGIYLKLNTDLNYFTGRVWWTGGQGQVLKKQPMGRNIVGKVPHDLAKRFNLANADQYTFHSFCRTSATSAGNGGMTTNQMQSFFGWKNVNICQECISTSRPAILHMAQTLANVPFDLSDPEVEIEVVVAEEDASPLEAVVGGDKGEKEKKVEAVEEAEKVQEASNDFNPDLFNFNMEEDPEMYEAAGIPVSQTSTANNSVKIQKTIHSAISAVPGLKDSNVTVKVVVMGSNYGSVNF